MPDRSGGRVIEARLRPDSSLFERVTCPVGDVFFADPVPGKPFVTALSPGLEGSEQGPRQRDTIQLIREISVRPAVCPIMPSCVVNEIYYA